MSWIGNYADREAALSGLPEIGERFAALHASFFQLPQLPAETLELCRLRLAQLHRSQADFDLQLAAVDADKREHLVAWARHSAFSEAERACLEITEVHAMDARAITDSQADAVKAHFGEEGLVALFQALGTFDGMIRLGLIWGLSPGVRDGQ